MKAGLLSGMVCPVATHDVSTNLKNRNNAFKKYGYGPPNPNDANDAFWLKKAKMYNAPTSTVKDMRCGNCAAFIQTPKMMECIKGGLESMNESEKELSYDQQFIDAANLGFCELFHFTCAAKRTCDAWKSGGPITKD
jgi:hypothetical protein